VIKDMMDAGMDVVRLNFSHGSHKDHSERIKTIREVSEEVDRPIALLQDLQGPKIRTGEMEDGVVLKDGSETVITMEDCTGTAQRFSSTYKDLASDVLEGASIMINDGLLRLSVENIRGDDIHCRVIHGGPLSSHKGINLVGASISAPALTNKDVEDLEFGLSQGLDYVALSFVKEASDIKQVLDAAKRKGKTTQVVAKVERHEAIDALDGIVCASDAVMVARGDLGVEIPLEQVPMIQKQIIRTCSEKIKPVITATQMLESMIQNPVPTRAEVSDVANAILDGTDAIMLSGETAVGKYPVEAVRNMNRIAETVESLINPNKRFFEGHTERSNVPNSVGHASCQLALNLDAQAIVCFTERGNSARILSKYRHPFPVIAVTPDEATQRKMALYWGVQSLRLEEKERFRFMVEDVERAALEKGLINRGDLLVLQAGVPGAITGVTNQIRVHRVGEEFAA